MIHINSNDPEHMKARQNVKPLTMEEEKAVIYEISRMIKLAVNDREWNINTDNIQRLIYRYENLKHLEAVTGEYSEEKLKEWKRALQITKSTNRHAYSEDEIRTAREAQIKNVSQAIDDIENYDKVHFTHEVNLQTGEEKIVNLGNWIDVKDRFPETNGVYIVVDKYNEIYGDAIYGFDKKWTLIDGFDGVEKPISDVTHWQPLPEPPKTLKSNIPKK